MAGKKDRVRANFGGTRMKQFVGLFVGGACVVAIAIAIKSFEHPSTADANPLRGADSGSANTPADDRSSGDGRTGPGAVCLAGALRRPERRIAAEASLGRRRARRRNGRSRPKHSRADAIECSPAPRPADRTGEIAPKGAADAAGCVSQNGRSGRSRPQTARAGGRSV